MWALKDNVFSFLLSQLGCPVGWKAFTHSGFPYTLKFGAPLRIDWLRWSGWPADWMIVWLVGYLAGWLAARLVGWKAFHPVGSPHSLNFWPPVARRLVALD